MATYQELKAKAEKMMAEAEQARKKEMGDVVAGIKEKIKLHGLSAQDLGFSSGAGTRRRSASNSGKTPAPAKYRGPNGETWAGGRGRKPAWVAKALAAGKKIEDFAI